MANESARAAAWATRRWPRSTPARLVATRRLPRPHPAAAKTLGENLEVIDERFHLRLHFFALWRDNPRRFGFDRPLVLDLVHGLPDDFQAFAHFRDAN